MSASHDRVIAALENRLPDGVPVMDMMVEYANIYEILGKRKLKLAPLIQNPYVAKAMDFAGAHAFTTLPLDIAMDGFTYDRTAASVKMGYDCAWVGHVPIWMVGDSRTMVDIYGRKWAYTFDGRGNLGTPMYVGGLIDSPEAWRAWDKRGIFKLPGKNRRAYARCQKDFGDSLYIMGGFSGGLFEVVWQSMGFERFVVCTRKEKALLHRMIGFYTDLYCLILEAMADAGLPAAIYSDDLAYRSGPMLNPRTLEEFFGEGHRRLTSTAHALGMKIVIHSCGNVYDLIGWFADNGFDGVHALEPTAGVELARAKEIAAGRICLLGNIDVTHILVDASRDEVFEAVRKAIEEAGSGGGYIVAPTNSHPGISVQRLRWMIEATRQYG